MAFLAATAAEGGRDGESTQDGYGTIHSDIARARLVAAADCRRAGRGSRDGLAVRRVGKTGKPACYGSEFKTSQCADWPAR